MSFDYTLKDASLGGAVKALQEYSARQRRVPPAPPGKFLTEHANVRVDVTAAAEGRYGEPFSYQGTGTAQGAVKSYTDYSYTDGALRLVEVYDNATAAKKMR